MHTEIFPMNPRLVQTIWGGTKLKEYKKKGLKNIGESWEISALENACSKYNDMDLTELIESNRKYFLHNSNALSFLIKFIDTTQNLSIQVHPNDEFASELEKCSGKNECWTILDAEEGCGIYLGLKENVTHKMLLNKIKEKEDLSKLLNFFPVKRGDFFWVPAGTVHAIGQGITLLEVQQSSGITYRLWDWNRLDPKTNTPRQLHIDKGLKVINFNPECNNLNSFMFQKDVLNHNNDLKLVEGRYFDLHKYSLKNGQQMLDLSYFPYRPKALICVQGEIFINRGNDNLRMEAFETAFLPVGATPLMNVNGNSDAVFFMVT